MLNTPPISLPLVHGPNTGHTSLHFKLSGHGLPCPDRRHIMSVQHETPLTAKARFIPRLRMSYIVPAYPRSAHKPPNRWAGQIPLSTAALCSPFKRKTTTSSPPDRGTRFKQLLGKREWTAARPLSGTRLASPASQSQEPPNLLGVGHAAVLEDDPCAESLFTVQSAVQSTSIPHLRAITPSRREFPPTVSTDDMKPLTEPVQYDGAAVSASAADGLVACPVRATATLSCSTIRYDLAAKHVAPCIRRPGHMCAGGARASMTALSSACATRPYGGEHLVCAHLRTHLQNSRPRQKPASVDILIANSPARHSIYGRTGV
ncbi:hypothetical protein LXA43DRAFT_1052764 [Ganoderma leucocontextum]|nr:hypothetical protein LXA43DRAFT_1052739 [Ganoderma leucocontextum]KAI1782167.1 hypothetical protein LXA43DRAFT_1052764 [Ganoderma leucocontextum]